VIIGKNNDKVQVYKPVKKMITMRQSLY
jgi:hypothetical protein